MPEHETLRGKRRPSGGNFIQRADSVVRIPPEIRSDPTAALKRVIDYDDVVRETVLRRSPETQPVRTDRRKRPTNPKEVQFSAFYRAEKVRVMRFLMKLGADAHEADDIAQSAFMEAWTSWDRIHTNKGAWVRRVATNKFFRSGPRHEIPTSDVPDRLGTLVADVTVELGEAARTVNDLLAELPVTQRIVLAWKADGFSIGEIARATPCRTEAAVRKNLQRARATMKRLLDAREGGSGGE